MHSRTFAMSLPSRSRISRALVALLACAMPSGAALAQVVTACPAALETTQLFPYTGSPATFTVPGNVNSVRVIAVGADGGEIVGGNAGGAGARAEGTFAVTAGQVFTVIAGQAPPGANDFEAGGGGASGAYLAGTLALIAGGGGGDDNTGNGGAGTATTSGSAAGSPTGGDCEAGGAPGTGGAGGQAGEAPGVAGCQTGDGGAGGGGLLAAGGGAGSVGGHVGPLGGAQCSIAGAAGGSGGTGDPTNADSIGARGGFGLCGGGGADHREGGGGGGYSGGGGGPESTFPGGGGSFVAATATAPTLVAGSAGGFGGGSGRNGSVRVCYTTRADLQITKTNTPAAGASDQAADTVLPGSAQTYTVVVTNAGGAPADGAAVRDPVPTGLVCTTATCGNAVNGAVCPAQTGAALLTALQSANGVVIPTLPNTGALTFTVSCTVQ